MNHPHQRDTNALSNLARTLNLSIPPHRIYQYPQQYNLNPIKRNAMQWLYGTSALTGFTLLNIFNKFNIEDWKSILSLMGALTMLVMWAHGKIKDRKHKDRMKELEYQDKLFEMRKKMKPYDEEKELGI